MINSPLLGCRVESTKDPAFTGVVQCIFKHTDGDVFMKLRRDDGKLQEVWFNDNWRVIDDTDTDTDPAASDPLDFKGKRVKHPEMGTGLVMNVTYVELGSAVATMQMEDGRVVTRPLGSGWSIVEDGPAADATADPGATPVAVINSANFTPDQINCTIVGLLRLARGMSSIDERMAIDDRIDELLSGVAGAQISMGGPEVDPAVIEPILAALGG